MKDNLIDNKKEYADERKKIMQKLLKITLALMLVLLAGCSSDESDKKKNEDSKQLEESINHNNGLLYTTDKEVVAIYKGYTVVKSVEGSVGVGVLDPQDKRIN